MVRSAVGPADDFVLLDYHCLAVCAGHDGSNRGVDPASATEQTVRPEFDLDDGEEGKRGRLRSLRLMHYMKKLEDVAPTAEADSKGRRKASSKTSTEGAGVEEGETVFDSVVQLTGDLRIAKTPEVSAATAVMEGEGSVQKPPEVVPGKMHLPPHWRHAGPSAEQQAILDAATAEAVRSIQGDIVNAARGEDTPPID